MDVTELEDNICIICLENVNNEEKIEELQMFKDHYKNICKCSYLIHKKCFKKWCNFNKSCPLCRKDFIYSNNIFNNQIIWATYYNDNNQDIIDLYERRRQQLNCTKLILFILFVIIIAYLPLWIYNFINTGFILYIKQK